ncbi:MAG TPA: HAMP domain-containing sensor histidine kinase [Kiritimatiellia bacterium]|nr:HAMP domain-containing sensor histidine kinase [Kiritimatiellia bacterium]
MKPSLRSKYFGWLVILMLLVYALITAVFAVIEFREAREAGEPFSKEFPEILALITIMLFTVPAVIIVAWNIAGHLLRPLDQMLTTAEHIRLGALEERIPELPQDDELSKLATTINDAFDRYAMAVRRLEEFSAFASHQLRTPLAAIKTSAEVTLRSTHDEAHTVEVLGDILEQTEKLCHTLDQLLLLAKMDPLSQKDFQPVDLDAALNKWSDEANAMMDRKMVVYSGPGMSKLEWFRGNETLLKQCFDNLLNNAIAAIDEDGTIAVTLSAPQYRHLIWTFEDSGTGIAKEDLLHIFDRFYQGRNPTPGGSGLGLAIVREIVVLHGGSITAAKSAELGGAMFTIRFPA